MTCGRSGLAAQRPANPLQLPPSNSGGDFYEFVYGLLIPLLVFMPAHYLTRRSIIDLITEEYQHDTLETLISTPITFTEMVWGKVLACEVLVPVQAGAWLVLLLINGIAIDNAPPDPGTGCRYVADPYPARHPHGAPLPGADCGTVHLLNGTRGRDPVRPLPTVKPDEPTDQARGGHRLARSSGLSLLRQSHHCGHPRLMHRKGMQNGSAAGATG